MWWKYAILHFIYLYVCCCHWNIETKHKFDLMNLIQLATKQTKGKNYLWEITKRLCVFVEQVKSVEAKTKRTHMRKIMNILLQKPKQTKEPHNKVCVFGFFVSFLNVHFEQEYQRPILYVFGSRHIKKTCARGIQSDRKSNRRKKRNRHIKLFVLFCWRMYFNLTI